MPKKILKYPNKSHRKIVSLPKDSIDLAEFFGIMIGDGGLNNDWQATISLNAKSDQSYSSYISCLCYKLFKTKTKSLVKEAKNTLIIYLNSTTIVDFLMDKGLPRGNKLKAGLKIPEWIFENNEFRKACVRGLIDTDGCLF